MAFPRTDVEDLSLSRLIIGINWFLGYSHTSNAKTAFIKEHQTRERLADIIEVFLRAGIDTVTHEGIREVLAAEKVFLRDAVWGDGGITETDLERLGLHFGLFSRRSRILSLQSRVDTASFLLLRHRGFREGYAKFLAPVVDPYIRCLPIKFAADSLFVIFVEAVESILVQQV